MIELLALGIIGLMAAGFADMVQGPPQPAPFRKSDGYYQLPVYKSGEVTARQLSHQYSALTCAMRVQEVTGTDGVKRVATDLFAFRSDTFEFEAARMIQILPSGDYTIEVLTEIPKLSAGHSSNPSNVQSTQIGFLKVARLADRCDTSRLPPTTQAVLRTLTRYSGSQIAKLATR